MPAPMTTTSARSLIASGRSLASRRSGGAPRRGASGSPRACPRPARPGRGSRTARPSRPCGAAGGARRSPRARTRPRASPCRATGARRARARRVATCTPLMPALPIGTSSLHAERARASRRRSACDGSARRRSDASARSVDGETWIGVRVPSSRRSERADSRRAPYVRASAEAPGRARRRPSRARPRRGRSSRRTRRSSR